MPLTQIWFPCAARNFSPRVSFQCRLSYTVHTLPCALACICTCTHIKDPIVHVRVQWIMETLKHQACTVGWVAWLCCSWLSSGKATQISHGRNPIGQYSCKNQKSKWCLWLLLMDKEEKTWPTKSAAGQLAKQYTKQLTTNLPTDQPASQLT